MSAEYFLMQYITELRKPLLTEIMLPITALGSITIAVTTNIALYLQKEPRISKQTAVSLLITQATVYPLKSVIGRARPQEIMPEVMVSTASFPSGHTATAFALAPVLSQKLNRKLVFTLASLVGASRIYLGAHYPSDVVAGALLGLSAGHVALNKDRIQTKLSETISSTFP